jgi:hypothetical protein
MEYPDGRQTPQMIEVRKGNNPDMRIAVVRRIVIIREHEHRKICPGSRGVTAAASSLPAGDRPTPRRVEAFLLPRPVRRHPQGPVSSSTGGRRADSAR